MNIHYTTQFKKDYKRLKRQNKNLAKLESMIRLLVNGQPLEPKYKDHSLTGNWKGHHRHEPDRNCLCGSGNHFPGNPNNKSFSTMVGLVLKSRISPMINSLSWLTTSLHLQSRPHLCNYLLPENACSAIRSVEYMKDY